MVNKRSIRLSAPPGVSRLGLSRFGDVLWMHDDVPPALTMGERVRARRLELGINQAECAKAIGITRAGLSQLEENKTHSLNSDAFARLLVLLKADHVYLVWGRKTPPPVAPKRRK